MMAGSASGHDAGGSGFRPRAYMNILETDGEKLLAAVRDLLAAKGLVSNAEIAERIAITDAANPGQGARMVAKAWTDPTYRALMLEDGTKAAEELGIPMRGAPPLGVLENTAEVHQPRRLHAVQLLSARGAGLSAVLVQVGRLSRPRACATRAA